MSPIRAADPRIRDLRADTGSYGAVYVDLDRGLEFDDAVLALIPDNVDGGYLRLPRLPQDQVCYASTPDNESLPNPDWQQELWFVDLRDYWTKTDLDGEIRDEISDEVHTVDHRTRLVGAEPHVRPVFLGWEFSDVDRWVTSAIADLSVVSGGMQETDDGSNTYVLLAVTVDDDVGVIGVDDGVLTRTPRSPVVSGALVVSVAGSSPR